MGTDGLLREKSSRKPSKGQKEGKQREEKPREKSMASTSVCSRLISSRVGLKQRQTGFLCTESNIQACETPRALRVTTHLCHCSSNTAIEMNGHGHEVKECVRFVPLHTLCLRHCKHGTVTSRSLYQPLPPHPNCHAC